LVAVAEPPKGPDEPVDFVSDADGKAFGSGSVAAGGTADVGAVGASATQGRVGAARSTLSDQRRRPRLTEPDVCHGYFPQSARADHGVVNLSVDVRQSGEVARVSVISENPAGEGFGSAATRCVEARTFEPGLDARGRPVDSAASLLIRFNR
jgi:hypothetical protein